jgi:hypothetical protein
MANDGGTPTPLPGTGNGGTGGAGGDGTGGRSPSVEDLKALEQKHRENLEKERKARADAEARIAELERVVSRGTSAPPVDPEMQRIRELQERAGYDDNAAVQLDLMRQQTITALENKLLSEIMMSEVPRTLIPAVQQIVRESGYQRSVADAMKFARGSSYDQVADLAKKQAEEIETLKKAVEAARTRVPNFSTPPAPAVDESARTIASSQYNAVLDRGGPEAIALMKRVNSPRGTPGHLELEFGA